MADLAVLHVLADLLEFRHPALSEVAILKDNPLAGSLSIGDGLFCACALALPKRNDGQVLVLGIGERYQSGQWI